MADLIYTQAQLNRISNGPIPKHIAIIPDGNRRWAKKHFLQALVGHSKGCSVITDIVQAAKELGTRVLTAYTFSTENWLRPKSEVDTLMNLLETYLVEQKPRMVKNGVRLCSIGDTKGLPAHIQKQLQETKEATAHNKQIDFVLALNYGSRDEMRRGFLRILDDYADEKIKREEITEETISRYLDTSPWGDPDLLIRTSGEQRISNFLLWQLSYSELYMTSTLWPDFTPEHLLEAIACFQKRQRRLGE